MKTRLIHTAILATAILFAVGLLASFAHAQTVLPAATDAAATNVNTSHAPTAALTDLLVQVVTKYPRVAAVILLYALAAAIWQAIIGVLHQRAAATSDPTDDTWLATLEGKTWFRFIDCLFYWGGYLGSLLGGRKL